MASKKANEVISTPAAPTNTSTLMKESAQGKSKERQFAEIALSPTTLNTMTARIFSKGTMGEIGLAESIIVMRDKVGKVNAGDTSELEATLTAQVVSLDAIFNELAIRAALNMGECMPAMESYMRLALKAQAQCARTIEVLAAMKNPPVVFVKQANFANGPQQVNNGIPSPAGKNEIEQSKLLTKDDHATLDTSGTATPIGVNHELETVAAINRPENS